jgi:hypothetical protein
MLVVADRDSGDHYDGHVRRLIRNHVGFLSIKQINPVLIAAGFVYDDGLMKYYLEPESDGHVRNPPSVVPSTKFALIDDAV